MKGGKEDGEKLMGPLFPRLHVNDTADKGGPRAPPRNKMALYEQLSIPSQRFGSSAGSVPLPLHNNGAVFPSASSSQGCGHDRSLLTSFYVQQAQSYSTDKVHCRLSDGTNGSAASANVEPKSLKSMGFKSSSVSGHTTAECTSFHPHDVSNTRDLCGRKIRDEDDFMVPTFTDSGNAASMNKEKVDLANPPTYSGHCTATATSSPQKHVTSSCNCAAQLWRSEDKSGTRPNNSDKKSIESGNAIDYVKRPADEKQNGLVPNLHSTEKITSTPDTEVTLSQRRYEKSTLNQDHLCGSLNDVGDMCNEAGPVPDSTYGQPSGENACSNEDSAMARSNINRENAYSNEASSMARSNINRDMSEREHFLRIRNVHRSRDSPANSNGSPSEKIKGGKLQPADKDRNDDASETSMLDSVSVVLEISPDDVVGVIGPKQFWKARRAILNQQRLFSVQVFELHRLIKVQKLFAGSPQLLLDDELYLTIPSRKAADSKILSHYNSRPQPPTADKKEESLNLGQNAKCSADNSAGKLVSPVDSIMNKGLANQASSNGHCDGYQSEGPVTTDGKNAAWCFPPLPAQWLVPVVSPTEGLIYKPFTGPCPPAGGLMSPVYGGCTPLSLPVAGDTTNPAYMLPPSHQQGGVAILPGAPSYFPPYGLHVVNPMLSGCAPSEQANAPPANPLHSQAAHFSAAEANLKMHSRGSCNMSSQKGKVASCRVVKVQASKDSEFQGSTASIPSSRCERVQEAVGQASEGQDSMQFFPRTPAAVENLDRGGHAQSSENQSRVIKVVPHNARSASESAARIFRSIQKERQLYDAL